MLWVEQALLVVGAMVTGGSMLATAVLARPLPIALQIAVEVLVYGTASAASALAAVRAQSKRLAWSALAAGIAVYGCGDLLFTIGVSHTIAGIAAFDVLYVVGYVGLGAVVPLLIRTLGGRLHISIWLDAATVVLGGLAAATAFLISPAYEVGTGDQSTAALLYVCADVVLLAGVATLGSILGVQRARAVVGSAIALLILLVGDGYYYWGTVAGSYVVGAQLDHSYLVCMMLLAWVAHRSPHEPAVADNLQRPRLDVAYLVMPVVGAGLALFTVMRDAFSTPATPVPAVLAVSCIAAGTARVLITLSATRSFYELREQVTIDPLTGLGNRRALTGHLDRALSAGLEDVTILLVDVDQFREINRAVGSAAGDQVLCRLTERLRAAAPAGAVLVRLSGDCFAVAAPARDGIAAAGLADKLQAAERAPFMVSGRRVRVTLSIGCAVGRPGQTTTAELLHQADLALVAAQGSRTGIASALPSASTSSAAGDHRGTSVQLVDDLHQALSAKASGLQLWFQPQLHMNSPTRTTPNGAVTTTLAGCEALLRWHHPSRGILGPATVLAAAEHGRLLPQVTAVVIRQALDHAAAWWPIAQLPVSVNFSAQDLDDPELPQHVMHALAQRKLPPWALTVEIVEDTVMVDPARARRVLGELREAGVHISIDDYGTGYSSLAYLHELPVDELKLDRSLTADVTTSPQSAAIIRHSVALAHDLGLLVVAEGVEDAGSLAALQQLGCDVVQGFLLGRPMPAPAWSHWMLDHYAPRRPSPPRDGELSGGALPAANSGRLQQATP